MPTLPRSMESRKIAEVVSKKCLRWSDRCSRNFTVTHTSNESGLLLSCVSVNTTPCVELWEDVCHNQVTIAMLASPSNATDHPIQNIDRNNWNGCSRIILFIWLVLKNWNKNITEEYIVVILKVWVCVSLFLDKYTYCEVVARTTILHDYYFNVIMHIRRIYIQGQFISNTARCYGNIHETWCDLCADAKTTGNDSVGVHIISTKFNTLATTAACRREKHFRVIVRRNTVYIIQCCV